MIISEKNYRCCGATCTKRRKEKTNHYGKIYNITCPVCLSEGRGLLQAWECIDPVPQDGWIPNEWQPITLIIKGGLNA